MNRRPTSIELVYEGTDYAAPADRFQIQQIILLKSLPLELRSALLDEGRSAFLHIFGAGSKGEVLCLKLQPCGKVCIQSLVDRINRVAYC